MKANILKRMSASLAQQIPIIYPRIYWKTKLEQNIVNLRRDGKSRTG